MSGERPTRLSIRTPPEHGWGAVIVTVLLGATVVSMAFGARSLGSTGALLVALLLMPCVVLAVVSLSAVRYSVEIDGQTVYVQKAFTKRRHDLSKIAHVRFQVQHNGVDWLRVHGAKDGRSLTLRLGTAHGMALPREELAALADLVVNGLDQKWSDEASKDAAERLRRRAES